MIFIKVALKNMLTRRKRTLVILFSIALSVTVILFVQGMVEGVKQNFFANMLKESGHLQILPSGQEDALDPYDLRLLLNSPDEMVKDLAKRSQVASAEKVLTFGCMLVAGDKNLTITGTGSLRDSIFFAKARNNMTEGEFLAPDANGLPGITVSTRISSLLGVSSGDRMVVLTEDSTGSPWYVEYTITGLFETTSREFDEGTFFLPHAEAENLLYVPGATREIRVLLKDIQLAESLKKTLAALSLYSADSGTAGTEIKTWREIHGSYLVLIDLFDIFIVFMDLFTVIVAATVITNSILMNVFERTREHGTLRAIGMKKTADFRPYYDRRRRPWYSGKSCRTCGGDSPGTLFPDPWT